MVFLLKSGIRVCFPGRMKVVKKSQPLPVSPFLVTVAHFYFLTVTKRNISQVISTQRADVQFRVSLVFFLFYQCSSESALVRSFGAWWHDRQEWLTEHHLFSPHADVAWCCNGGNYVTKCWIHFCTAAVRTPQSHFLPLLAYVWHLLCCLKYEHMLCFTHWARHLLISAFTALC